MELDYRLWRLKPSEFNENKKEQLQLEVAELGTSLLSLLVLVLLADCISLTDAREPYVLKML